MTRSDVTPFTVTIFLRFLRTGVAGSVMELRRVLCNTEFILLAHVSTTEHTDTGGRHGRLKAVLKVSVEQGALKPEEAEKQAGNLGTEVSNIG